MLNESQRKALLSTVRVAVDSTCESREIMSLPEAINWLRKVITPIEINVSDMLRFFNNNKEYIEEIASAINIPNDIRDAWETLVTNHILEANENVPNELMKFLQASPNNDPCRLMEMHRFQNNVRSIGESVRLQLIHLRELFLEMTPMNTYNYGVEFFQFSFRIGDVPLNLDRFGPKPVSGEIQEFVKDYVEERLEYLEEILKLEEKLPEEYKKKLEELLDRVVKDKREQEKTVQKLEGEIERIKQEMELVKGVKRYKKALSRVDFSEKLYLDLKTKSNKLFDVVEKNGLRSLDFGGFLKDVQNGNTKYERLLAKRNAINASGPANSLLAKWQNAVTVVEAFRRYLKDETKFKDGDNFKNFANIKQKIGAIDLAKLGINAADPYQQEAFGFLKAAISEFAQTVDLPEGVEDSFQYGQILYEHIRDIFIIWNSSINKVSEVSALLNARYKSVVLELSAQRTYLNSVIAYIISRISETKKGFDKIIQIMPVINPAPGANLKVNVTDKSELTKLNNYIRFIKEAERLFKQLKALQIDDDIPAKMIDGTDTLSFASLPEGDDGYDKSKEGLSNFKQAVTDMVKDVQFIKLETDVVTILREDIVKASSELGFLYAKVTRNKDILQKFLDDYFGVEADKNLLQGQDLLRQKVDSLRDNLNQFAEGTQDQPGILNYGQVEYVKSGNILESVRMKGLIDEEKQLESEFKELKKEVLGAIGSVNRIHYMQKLKGIIGHSAGSSIWSYSSNSEKNNAKRVVGVTGSFMPKSTVSNSL